MQAIILAAGLSKRLRPLTDTKPKCLLDVNGKNLLHRTIENIMNAGINKFIIVTGYKENMIKKYVSEKFLKRKKSKPEITFITNSDYENNNNSYSLWMTKKFVKNDIILLDSDILFDKGILEELIESGYENCLAVNVTKNLDSEQIKVKVSQDSKILEIGKEVKINESIGESIGIEKMSSRFMKEIFKILDRKIIKEKNVNEFYEVTFQEIIDSKKMSLYSVDVSGYRCIEIDTLKDYISAQNLEI